MPEYIRQFVLNKCNYGLYVITSTFNGKINGQISDALMQVTSNPPKVALSIHKQELTHEYIEKSGVFAASILRMEVNLDIIKKFGFKSGREVDKFKDTKYTLGKTGSPLLIDDIVGTFESKVFKSVDVGTHTLFIGDVINANIVRDEPALTYCYYREQLKAKLHANSPSA